MNRKSFHSKQQMIQNCSHSPSSNHKSHRNCIDRRSGCPVFVIHCRLTFYKQNQVFSVFTDFAVYGLNGAFLAWQCILLTWNDLLIGSRPLEISDVMVRAEEEDACNMVMGFAVQMGNSQIDTRKQAINPAIHVYLLSICNFFLYLFYGM